MNSNIITTPVLAAVEMLTPSQLASRLNVSRRTLSNWTRNRLLPMLKVGRCCRFDYHKVQAVLAQYELPVLSRQDSAAATPESAEAPRSR